jgi:formyltetrahydrofolate synthetase
VVSVCETHRAEKAHFNYMYPLATTSIKDKVAAVAASYGAAGVEFEPEAEAQIEAYTKVGQLKTKVGGED